MAPFAAGIAIDWSDAKHALGRVDTSTSQTEDSILKHTPEDLAAWATAWRARVAEQPMAVCLEPSRGPLIEALLKDDLGVLYPITPTTLATYREACSPSRAKAEPRAAASRLAWLRHHRDRRRAWRPHDAKTRTRPYLVEHRRRLVHDRTRLSPRLTARLNAYVPHV